MYTLSSRSTASTLTLTLPLPPLALPIFKQSETLSSLTRRFINGNRITPRHWPDDTREFAQIFLFLSTLQQIKPARYAFQTTIKKRHKITLFPKKCTLGNSCASCGTQPFLCACFSYSGCAPHVCGDLLPRDCPSSPLCNRCVSLASYHVGALLRQRAPFA